MVYEFCCLSICVCGRGHSVIAFQCAQSEGWLETDSSILRNHSTILQNTDGDKTGTGDNTSSLSHIIAVS